MFKIQLNGLLVKGLAKNPKRSEVSFLTLDKANRPKIMTYLVLTGN